VDLDLWGLMPLSTIFQLYRGSFIGGGNRSTRRKPPTWRKSLTNFITGTFVYLFYGPIKLFEILIVIVVMFVIVGSNKRNHCL
jgi:hypothetical protein